MIKIGQGSEAVVYLCYEAHGSEKKGAHPYRAERWRRKVNGTFTSHLFHVGPRVIIIARPWQCGRNRHHPPEDVDSKKERKKVKSSK